MRARITAALTVVVLIVGGALLAHLKPAWAQVLGGGGGGGSPTGTASGDLAGTYPSPTLNTTIATVPSFTNGIRLGASSSLDCATGSCTMGIATGNNVTQLSVGTGNNVTQLGLPQFLTSNAYLKASSTGFMVSTTTEHDFCAYNSANLAAAAAFSQTGVTNASTLVASSAMVHDIAGAGTGTFVAKLCSDGVTCGAGNVYLTCTAGATCAAAVAGRIDGCTVTKSAVPAATTLTWSVGTACGTTDPGINVCAHMTTP